MKTSAKSVIKATAVSLTLLASLSLTACSTQNAPESVRSGDGVENSSSATNLSVFTIAYRDVETDCTLQSMYETPGSMVCDFENKRTRHPDTSEAPLGTDVSYATIVVHGRTVDCISYQAWDKPGGVECDYAGNPVKVAAVTK
jgi:hypothetical protein